MKIRLSQLVLLKGALAVERGPGGGGADRAELPDRRDDAVNESQNINFQKLPDNFLQKLLKK